MIANNLLRNWAAVSRVGREIVLLLGTRLRCNFRVSYHNAEWLPTSTVLRFRRAVQEIPRRPQEDYLTRRSCTRRATSLNMSAIGAGSLLGGVADNRRSAQPGDTTAA